MPGKIENIQIQVFQPDPNSSYVYLHWLEFPKFYTLKDTSRRTTYDTVFQGYVEHSYIWNSRHGQYYFIKYIDYTKAALNAKVRTIMEEIIKDSLFYILTRSDINCTSDKSISKTFSWIEASLLCQSMNATLPEFNSRKEQEEFIAFLKSEEVFPIEAVFIGLYMNTEVALLNIMFLLKTGPNT